MGTRTPHVIHVPTLRGLRLCLSVVDQVLDTFTEDIFVGSHSISLLAPQFLVVFAHLFRIGFDSFFKLGKVMRDFTTLVGKFDNDIGIRADYLRQRRSLCFHTIRHRSCFGNFVSHFIFLCPSGRLFEL